MRRIAGGLGVEPGERVAVVLDNRVETALLYWAAPMGRRRVRPAVVARLARRSSTTASRDCGARVVVRDGDALPDGAEHPGALDRDERDLSLQLYTSGTTGRPKGVPRSHRPIAREAWSQALQHGYGWADRTLGVMPLYHTMGIHSLLAMHLLGGCFVPQARWDAGEALRADRGAADDLALPRRRRSSTTSSTTPTSSDHDLSSVRALGYAGAAMTSTLVRRCLEVFAPDVFVNHYGSTEVYTFIDRPRPARASPAAPGGRPSTDHGSALDRRRARSSSTSAPTRRSAATGTAPTPTRRRSARAGTTRATRATSMPTATSGSMAGSTT